MSQSRRTLSFKLQLQLASQRVIIMKRPVLLIILGLLLPLVVVTADSVFSVIPEDLCVTVGRIASFK